MKGPLCSSKENRKCSLSSSWKFWSASARPRRPQKTCSGTCGRDGSAWAEVLADISPLGPADITGHSVRTHQLETYRLAVVELGHAVLVSHTRLLICLHVLPEEVPVACQLGGRDVLKGRAWQAAEVSV